ncbi:cell division protein FtsQ/DivIB [soil metagenome]
MITGIIVISSVVFANKWRSDNKYEKITISGNNTISRDDILSIARLKDSIGSTDDLNLKIIQDRISKHPEIKKVYVSKEPPAELKIEIIEKRPVAILNSGTEIKLIDNELEVFTYKNSEKLFDLPVISGVKISSLKSNEDSFDKGQLRTAIFLLINAEKKSKMLFNNISEINFSTPDCLTLYSNDNTVPFLLPYYSNVDISNKEYQKELLNKLNIFDALLKQKGNELERSRIQYIDLRFSNQAVVNYKQ